MLKKGLVISAFAALLSGGCDGGSVANNAATGGKASVTGGNQATGGVTTAATGGVTTATGGVTAATGGVTAATGGVTAGTGGVITATGGATPVTGGTKATGGTTPATTGGSTPVTGGTTPATGGTTPANGGAPATGGVVATGGTRTGGTSPDAGVNPNPDTASPDTAGSACIAAATPANLAKVHNAGKDCISCHSNNVPTTIAGTIYGADGKTAVSGATVTITGSNGAIVKLVTASNGNFWSNSAVSFPAKVEVSKCPDTAKMTKTLTSGSCNASGCHASTMPITLP